MKMNKISYEMLIDFEDLFDGTLGTLNCDPVAVDVKPDATPHHAKTYGVPQVHVETVKKGRTPSKMSSVRKVL